MKKIIIVSALLPLMAMAYEPTYSIKSTVWHDSNQNWEQDNDEPGLSSVKVVLYTASGEKIKTTKSWKGKYSFHYLKKGDYVVKVEVPKGMTAVTDTKLEVWLDKNRVDQNFGLYNEKHIGDYSIGNIVWDDANENWEQDNGEQGIAGVTVKLFNGGGKKISTTKTVYDGTYKFKELSEGDYEIRVEVPKEMRAVTDTKLEVYLDKTRSDKNFGLYQKEHKGNLKISSYVWNDANQNWKKDIGEKGINGVKVTLYKTTGEKVATTLTRWYVTHQHARQGYKEIPGYYKFNKLVEGDYIIKVEPPKGFASSTDSKLELWLEKDSKRKKNFGIYNKKNQGSYTIHSYVRIDTDKNGKIDYHDKGINNVKVNIYDNDGKKVASTLTNSNKYNHSSRPGHYKFENLIEGNYTIKIEVPKGMSAQTISHDVWINKNKTNLNFILK